MGILRDKVKVQVLINIAKKRERGRENKNSNSRNNAKEQDENMFVSIRFCYAKRHADCLPIRQKTPNVPHQTQSAKSNSWVFVFVIPSFARNDKILLHVYEQCFHRSPHANRNGGRIRPPLRKFCRYLSVAALRRFVFDRATVRFGLWRGDRFACQ